LAFKFGICGTWLFEPNRTEFDSKSREKISKPINHRFRIFTKWQRHSNNQNEMNNIKKQPSFELPVIDRLSFDLFGKIAIHFMDGRELIVPIKFFPEIKKLPVLKRKKYTIVNDRTILFDYASSIYHLEDFVGLESRWRMR
jgi:hypothetical protein